MRYYDTTIKTIEITYFTGMGQYKVENQRTIEVSKETSKFIYGTSWDGRYKYDKTKDLWFKYEYYGWDELRIKRD